MATSSAASPVVCSHRELRLRNYVPEDEDLKRRRVPPAKPVAGRWAASLQVCSETPLDASASADVVLPWEITSSARAEVRLLGASGPISRLWGITHDVRHQRHSGHPRAFWGPAREEATSPGRTSLG